jgi:hypothetical protein
MLFESFRWGAAVEQAGIEGLGLGLTIAKSIVDAQGGRIGATARRGGGLFWVELPALPAEPPAPGDATARQRLARPARGRAATRLAALPASARERN